MVETHELCHQKWPGGKFKLTRSVSVKICLWNLKIYFCLLFRFTKSQRFTIIPNVARIQLSGNCCSTIYQKFMYYGDFQDFGLEFNENLNYPKILSLKLYGC